MTSNRYSIESRWWYGVAISIAAVVATWLSWSMLHTVGQIQPGTPPALVPASDGLSMPFLASLLATVVFVVIVAATVPVFSVSLFLDSRRIRQSATDWSPSALIYGGVSSLHLASLVVPVLQLVTVPAGVWYLYRRHRSVGLR